MDFKQLDTFLAIARTKSFSKAAERLYLTQPSVSGHIARLEEELGTALLERNNRRTELTAAGRLFYRAALEMVNQRDRALFELQRYQNRIEGVLEIGASNIPDQYLLPPYVLRFHRLYPQVAYQLHHLSSREVEEALLEGSIDLGMVGSEPSNPHLSYHKIAEDELVVIAPFVAPFKDMTEITLDDLLKHRLLLRREGSASRRVFEEALKHYRGGAVMLNPLALLENNDLIILYVQQGLGLSVVSALSVREKVAAGRLCALPLQDLPLTRDFYFVYPAKRTLSPLVACFRAMVLETKDGFTQV